MSVFSKPRTLRVYPNPYIATDHKGRPAGAFQHEPNHVHGDTHVRHVGATRTAEEIAGPVMIAGFVVKEAEHDRSFNFTPEAEDVPNTDYYHRAIRSGELFAADKASFVEAGCNPQLFVEPATALANAKRGAADAQIAAYGEVSPELLDHWKEFHEAAAAESAPTPAPKSTRAQASAAPAKE